jgi:hypothetical protein
VSAVENFDKLMADWAQRTPSVQALILIGSRARAPEDAVWRPDLQSDWDFQIISSHPQMFSDAAWLRGIPGLKLQAYAVRPARIGAVPKVNAVFSGAEADFVIIPAKVATLTKLLVWLGLHRQEGRVRRRLRDLSVVIRPGWLFLKGAGKWEAFYRQIVDEVDDLRLSNDEARQLADGFVCDYVSILRKIDRGELRAAQRLIHRDLAEINFRLLHEIRLRQGERTFPEARRIERVADPAELVAVAIDAGLDASALRTAANKSAIACRQLMDRLVGTAWRWPDVG